MRVNVCQRKRKKALNKQMLKEEEKKIIKCSEERKISFVKQQMKIYVGEKNLSMWLC